MDYSEITQKIPWCGNILFITMGDTFVIHFLYNVAIKSLKEVISFRNR
jgi:hypothetical protein